MSVAHPGDDTRNIVVSAFPTCGSERRYPLVGGALAVKVISVYDDDEDCNCRCVCN